MKKATTVFASLLLVGFASYVLRHAQQDARNERAIENLFSGEDRYRPQGTSNRPRSTAGATSGAAVRKR